MSDITQTYSLSHRQHDVENQSLLIDMSEVDDVAMIDLRGKMDDAAFMKNVSAILGTDLPTVPRTSVKQGDVTVLWLSVDQWLITAPLKAKQKLMAGLTGKLKRNTCLVCDVSDARTVIRLTGEQVREVLIKGTSVDVSLPEFTPGTVRRLLFAEVGALCHFVDHEPDVVDLYVFRSYGNYVWEWLLQTAHEDTELGLFRNQHVPPV